ncbi:hypothetical protein HKCCE3408_05345 [Rhodobacterales bacterium HKCCE3408]|nr:hypothetical protein [Rhodobacterales bacterium HKCCE3408]
MAEDGQAEAGGEEGAEDRSLPVVVPQPKRRRGLKIAIKIVEIAGFLVLVPILFGIIAIFAATDNRVRLPQAVESRIAAGMNGAMQAGRIGVEEIAIALPDRGFTPEIVLSGVQLRDEQGLRAYLPEVSVVLNGGALLTGEVRPRRVRLDGAGMRLSRDRDGVIDLALSADPDAADRGITEALARIDALFGEPAFSELEEISGTGLVVLMADAVTGQIIRSQDAEMRLERKGAALTLTLSGSVTASRDARIDIAITRNPRLGRNDLLFAFENLAARDLATASPALAWLDLMRAPISGRLVAQVSDAGTVGDFEGQLDIGPGAITPRAGAEPIPLARLAADLAYDAGTRSLRFDSFDLASAPLSFSAAATAAISEDGREIVGQLSLSELTAAPADLFEEALHFEGGAADLRLILRPDLDLTIGQAVLFDDDLRVRVSGDIVAGDDGLVTRLDAQIPELSLDQVLPYWPAFVIPGTRDWVTENLARGEITGFAAALRTGPQGRTQSIRFDFDGLELAPLPGLPPITDGRGFVSAEGTRFVLSLTGGEIVAPGGGTLDLTGSSLVIGDTRPRNPDAVFDLAVAGPIETVGALLALPPVNLLAESPLDPATLATGRAEADVALSMTFRRVIPRDEIGFSATGTLSDVRSDTLVPGRELRARRLDLEVTPQEVGISGRASIDGVAVSGRWSQPMGTGEPQDSRAEGRLTVSADTLAAFGVNLPPGTVTGSGGADFVLDIPRGAPPSLALSSDLSGIGLSVPAIGYALGLEATGTLSAEITLGPTPEVPSLTLDAPGLDLAASVSLRPEGGGLDALSFSRARIGDWADLSGALTGRGPGAPPGVRIDGGTIDLRRLPSLAGGDGGGPISGRLDRLVLTEGLALTGLAADLAPGLAGNFQGRVNGGAAIRGSLVRAPQGLGLRVAADDAGAVLRSAGLFQNGYGGALSLSLNPTGEPGTYDGLLTVDGARVRDAPAMAELLNAVSVVGLIDQLGGEGINLGEIDARFRVTPRAIYLTEGSAIGPAIGISMDGVYDIGAQRYDMQGVVSPIYFLNGAAGALFAPRREGLFGVSYRMTGTGDETNVSVNPLSILTPGIFREIFRRPPPDVSQ